MGRLVNWPLESSLGRLACPLFPSALERRVEGRYGHDLRARGGQLGGTPGVAARTPPAWGPVGRAGEQECFGRAGGALAKSLLQDWDNVNVLPMRAYLICTSVRLAGCLALAWSTMAVGCGDSDSPTHGNSTGGSTAAGGGTSSGGVDASGGMANATGGQGASDGSGGQDTGGSTGGCASEPTDQPVGQPTTCFGEGCPLGECSDFGVTSEPSCSSVYAAPLDEGSALCDAGADGGYCLRLGATVCGRWWAVNCDQGDATVEDCSASGKSCSASAGGLARCQ
jgi:hypothetical protein